MRTLSYSFMIFNFCGVWRPVDWLPGWKTIVYDSYTNMMILIIYTFTISEFVDLMGSLDDVKKFANGSFMLLSMIGVCGKTANLLTKRSAIIELTNVLQNDMCRPRSPEEVQIQRECDRDARFNTLWYGALTGTAVVSITVRSLILDIPQRTLPFKAWLPYDHDGSQIGFWLAYVHQLVAHAVGAYVNVAFDTLVPGLLRQTCAQIKILGSRLHAIPKTIDAIKKSRYDENDQDNQKANQLLESELLTECVKHHLEIFQFAKTLNDIFGLAVFLQYSVSSIVICVSIYELSKMRLFSSEFTSIILYLTCMLVQIFNFCFCGDKVTLRNLDPDIQDRAIFLNLRPGKVLRLEVPDELPDKPIILDYSKLPCEIERYQDYCLTQSLEICDAVYGMDWTSFSLRTKRSLLTIMLRSLRPITFTCLSVIRLSLESFNDLIKLSYSAYNVLQKSGD